MPETDVAATSGIDQAAIAADILGTTPEEVGGAEPETTSAEDGTEAPDSEETQASSVDEPEDKGAKGGTDDEEGGSKKDPLEEFIASKYGGDRKKFVEGWFNLMNSGSKQHEELKATRAALEKIQSQLAAKEAEANQKPPEDSPDVARLKQQLAGVDKRATAYKQQQQRVVTDIDSLRQEIAELKGEARRVDNFDRGLIEQQLVGKQSELRGLEREWYSYQEKLEALDYDKLELKHRAEAYEQQQRETTSNRQQMQEAEAAYRREFMTDFNAAVDKAVSDQGYQTDSKTRAFIFKLAKADAREYLEQNPGVTIEPAKFIQDRAGEYFDALNDAKRSEVAKLTQAKGNGKQQTQVAKPTVPAKQTTKSQTLTYDQARANIKRIMGG